MINIFTKLNSRDRGMSIIEVAVAITFIMLAGTALMTMALTASMAVISARYKTMANKITKSLLEDYRAQRNNLGWEVFNTTYPTTAPCPNLTPTIVPNITPPIFNRTTCISQTPSGSKQIQISVTWQEKMKEQKITETTIISPWQ